MLTTAQLAAMPREQALALLNKAYKTPVGLIDWQQTGYGAGGDMTSALMDAAGNTYDWAQEARPNEFTGDTSQALFERNLSDQFRSTNDPTQYGYYSGIYDKAGNLQDVKWRQTDASGGWFSDNLEWLGPLIVGGAAMAGAGGMLPDFTMAGGGATGDALAIGGTAADTLGADAAASLISEAPMYDSLVTGALPSSISGSGVGAGIGANGVAGALDAAGTIGIGNAVYHAASSLLPDAVSSVLPAAVSASDLAKAALVTAAAVTGGDDKTVTKTTTNEPWEPAQNWLKENIKSGQALQTYYQDNPVNPLQKQAYQGLFDTIGNFKTQNAPALMDFASGMMNNRYQSAARPVMPASGSALLPQFSQGGAVTSGSNLLTAPQSNGFGLLDWSSLIPGATKYGRTS